MKTLHINDHNQGTFFCKLGHFFSIFEKGQGRPPPLPPLVTRLMVTVFKENLNLQLPFIFYSSIRFLFETVSISKQIAENRFGALLEISGKFITKFIVLAIWFCSSGLKQYGFKPYCMVLKTVATQFYLKGHSLYHLNYG